MELQLRELVENYKVSQEAKDIVAQTPIVLLVGISGAGKDTIKHRLLETGSYHHIVSHTTRAPRENAGVRERDGVDYYFISKEEAARMLREDAFIEAKTYSGNLYGTSVAEIVHANQEGKIAITDMEVQGVAEYKAISPKVIAEFILPPNFEEWQRRLHSRYGDQGADPADITKRMDTAIVELKEALQQAYYHFIVNEVLEDAVSAADKIAHDDNSFNTIDRSFSRWAEQLLIDLENHATVQGRRIEKA